MKEKERGNAKEKENGLQKEKMIRGKREGEMKGIKWNNGRAKKGMKGIW